LRRFRRDRGAILLLAVVAGLLCGLPTLRLLLEAASVEMLERLAFDARVWRAARRTLEVAVGSSAGAVLIGGGAALALGLVRVPGARVLRFLLVLGMLVPPQIAALAWLTALGPASPLLATLGIAPTLGAPHPLHGPWGIIVLLSVQHAPLVFLSVRAGLRGLGADQVEAARAFGGGFANVLVRIVLPLLAPSLAAGAALAALAAIGNFGTTAMLGLPARYLVLSVLVFSRMSALGPNGLSEAAGISLLLALIAGLVIAVQARIAGRRPVAALSGFRPLALREAGWAGRLIAAGLALYLCVALALPLAALVVAALTPAAGVALTTATATVQNFAAVLAPGANTLVAFRNSLLLSVTAALLLATLSVATVEAARLRPLALLIDLPYALPGVCIGVAAILVYLRPLPLLEVSLYGTPALILIAYLGRFFALAMKPVAAAQAALDRRLFEAASILGAGTWRRRRTIDLPLLAPGAIAGGLLVALSALNEITVSILLYSAGSQTLGVVVFGLNDSGQTGMAAAVALLALLLVAALMAATGLAARRLPRGALPWG
jgi:iron(III) transport system permease protein